MSKLNSDSRMTKPINSFWGILPSESNLNHLYNLSVYSQQIHSFGNNNSNHNIRGKQIARKQISWKQLDATNCYN